MADDARQTRPPLAFTCALLALAAILTVAAFAAASVPDASPATDETDATAVANALSAGSVSAGETLVEAYGCGVCHVKSEGRVAPLFAGIADRAAIRRPGIPAASYLYQSIVSPGAFLADDFANAMPANYRDRLTEAEIGSIIGYLLTLSDAD